MSANLFDSGVFTKQVSTFFKDSNIKYIIATRKKPTPTKPINYILAKVNSKTFYISSLYPTAEANKFDVENVIKMILNTLKNIKGDETFIYE